MPFNDDDFDFDDLSDEEKEEFEKERKEKKNRTKNHPLMIQAKEIVEMVNVLLETCNDETFAEVYGGTLRESTMMIRVKLTSALDSDSYLLCMQNAALIREHAQYLRLSNHSLKMSKGFDEQHVNMFRQEMEKFRMLFRDWIKEVRNMEEDYEDEWGLFVK
ncbi:MAG: hypothetical protein K0S33_1928 [Bacteroidetes bacterium]|jgi:hypothetical protein|nr:hypothetical protein [Bacteroidota bacterium]